MLFGADLRNKETDFFFVASLCPNCTKMQDKKRKYSEQFVEVPSTSTDKVRVFGDVLPCAVLLDRLSANTLASITEGELSNCVSV